MITKSFLVRIGADDSELQSKLNGAQKFMKDHAKQFKAVGAAMTAVGTAVIGSMGLMVKSYVEAGDEVQKMAKRTGFSTEALSELRYACDISGTSLGSLEKGVKRMSGTILDADDGLETYIRAFDHMGLKVEDLMGLKPEEQFFKIANAISSLEDPTMRAALAQDVFGRAGTELLPLFDQGTEGMEALRQKAHELGIVFDQEAADKAAKLKDAQTTLKESFKGVGFAIATTLAPAITSLVDKVSGIITKVKEWMEKHPELANLILKVSLVVGGLCAVLGPLLIMLPALASGFSLLTGPIGIVIGAIMGLVTVGTLVVANWEKIKGFFINIWRSIADFATNIFNEIKLAIVNSLYWIVDKIAKIPIVKKFAEPWRQSLDEIRNELRQTEQVVSEESIAMGKALLEAVKQTKIYATVSGFLGDKLKGLGDIFTTAKEKPKELSEAYKKSAEKIKEITSGLTDEIKKATLSDYEYSKWALEQKYLEKKAEIEAEKISEQEKFAALALLNETYRAQQEELDEEEKEKERERQEEHLQKLIEGHKAYREFLKAQDEAYKTARQELTNTINQLTMSELDYQIWAMDQEYEKRKADIDRTLKDEEEKAEILGLLDKEYRLKKEKAYKEHHEKLTKLEEETLSAVSTLYGNFLTDTLTAFEEWGEGKKSILQGVGDAFKSLVADAIGAIKQLVTEELMASAKTILAEKAKAIASIIAKVMASIPFPFNLAVVGGAIAAVTALFSKIKLFGEGGIAWGPQLAVVGEKGPELILPLSKAGEAGGMGSTFKQNVYFYGNINNAGSLDEISERLAEKVRRSIEGGRK